MLLTLGRQQQSQFSGHNITNKLHYIYKLITNSLAYETRGFSPAFTRALQLFQALCEISERICFYCVRLLASRQTPSPASTPDQVSTITHSNTFTANILTWRPTYFPHRVPKIVKLLLYRFKRCTHPLEPILNVFIFISFCPLWHLPLLIDKS